MQSTLRKQRGPDPVPRSYDHKAALPTAATFPPCSNRATQPVNTGTESNWYEHNPHRVQSANYSTLAAITIIVYDYCRDVTPDYHSSIY